MGHLYWQLNDVWAAPTWSTIDVAGQWKIAHYLAIRGTASITHRMGRAIVSRVRDRVLINWSPPVNRMKSNRIRLRVLCIPSSSFEIQPTVIFQSSDDRIKFRTPNRCPLEVTKFTLPWLRSRCSSGALTTVIENGAEQINETSLLLSPKEMKHFWPQLGASITVSSVRRVNVIKPGVPKPPFRWDLVFEIQLLAKERELFVWLVVDPSANLDGWFSDNAFDMLTSGERSLYYYVKGYTNISEEKLKTAIEIYTLSSVLSSA